MRDRDSIILESLYKSILLNESQLQHPPLSEFDKEKYPTAELVPVSYLNTIKEYDRRDKFSSWEFANFEEMEKEIFQNGMKYPLFVRYSVPDKSVLLIEGNHRLTLANKLKIKYLPVVVTRSMYKFPKEQAVKAKKVTGFKSEENTHIPSYIKPSEIGMPSIPIDFNIDNEYIELVKEPEKNKNKLEKIVSKVAEKKGYTIGPLQHKTSKVFYVFDLLSEPINRTGNPLGFYFAKNVDRYQGNITISAFLSIKNPFNLHGGNDINQNALNLYRKKLVAGNKHLDENDTWFDDQVKKFETSGRMPYTGMSGNAQREVLIAGGFDGVIDGPDYAALFPEQIKFSNYITYDDQDNIIPLSQRFDSSKDDIRY